MDTQQKLDFGRIKNAIEYINKNYRRQPSLEEVAAHVSLSPFHFQRMFSEWSGVSPKQFLQFISIAHAKGILQESRATLFDTAHEIGLSGTGRLHDLFIKIEGMTPGEYKNGGESLQINYSFMESPFGDILVASTSKGICHIAFSEDKPESLSTLKKKFPNAEYHNFTDQIQQDAVYIFTQDWQKPHQVKLHIKGSGFQIKVWEALLKIPVGKLATYSDIAQHTGNPNASRAVGTAIGQNPVAFLIPCHRVIKSTGTFGGYRWETSRKAAIIGWENAKSETISTGH